MELIALLLFTGVVFVVVGAVMGVLAKRENSVLRARLERLERELRELHRHWPAGEHVTDAVEAAAPPSAPPLVPAPPPLPPAEQPAPWVAPAWSGTPPWLQTDAHGGRESAEAPANAAAPEPGSPLAPDAALEPEAARPSEAARAPQPVQTPAPTVAAAPAAHASMPLHTPPPAEGTLGAGERAFGTRWLTWLGVGLLFLGVAFFLKYAYDRDWLGRLFGPRLRIATAAAAALALAATGWKSLRNGLVALGQGLLGGGQALLYLTVYAAFQPAALVVPEPLLGATAAFALMAAVTALGLAVAARLDAVAMAFLAVLGGFATPVLIQTGQDARDLLFAYLLLLDLGVLGVASYRQWRALDLLAFAGTALLFAGWWSAWHHVHAQPDATLAWLGVFHVVFLVLPFAQHWRRRTPATIERFALALANLAWTLAYAASMLREPAPRALAVGCLVASALYGGLGLWTARRVGGDTRTRDGFLALAVLLLTVGLFFLLPANAIATAWYAEAATLVYFGHRFAHPRTRTVALVVLAAAVVRTLAVHLPAADPAAAFVRNGWFATLVVAGLGLGAFAWMHRRYAVDGAERRLAHAIGIAAGLALCAATVGEIGRHAHGHPDEWARLAPALAGAWVWLAGTGAFFGWAWRWPSRATFVAALVPLTCAAIGVGIAYDRYPTAALLVLNGPCLTGLAVVAAFALAAAMAPRATGELAHRQALLGAAQLLATALATVETLAFVQRGDAQPGPTTVAQALAWVWLGIGVAGAAAATAWSSRRTLALAALPLTAALVTAFGLFASVLAPHRLIANQRFVFAALTSAVVAALRAPLTRLGAAAAGDAASAAALALMLAFGSAESITWSHAAYVGDAVAHWMLWLLGATFVAGAAGACWRAHATGNPALRGVGLTAIVPALALPLADYLPAWRGWCMFLNLRAGLVAVTVAVAFWWAHRDARLRALRYAAVAVALLGLTAEPPAWFLVHVDDPDEARRLALFSVTVTWIAAASASLVVGFRRDRRPLRLGALSLFVLTGAKVLVVDMSGALQVYRILAFLLVGVVFVGASWAYHRAERRLVAARAGGEAPDAPDSPDAPGTGPASD